MYEIETMLSTFAATWKEPWLESVLVLRFHQPKTMLSTFTDTWKESWLRECGAATTSLGTAWLTKNVIDSRIEAKVKSASFFATFCGAE